MSENENLNNSQNNEQSPVIDVLQLPDQVTCKAAKDPAVRVFILAAMCLGFGGWCFMDRHNHLKPEIWDAKHINEIFGYYLNNFGFWLLIPLGILVAILGFRMLKRVLTADAEGIGYKGKERFLWEDYTELDASKLKEKGLLEIYFKHGHKIVLDSWKLTNFKQLVAFVEEKIS